MDKMSDFWVDLQWHSDPEPDEGPAQPPIGFTSYEEDIEIVTPEEAAAQEEASKGGEKSREELMAELEELRKQAGAGAQQDQNPEVAALQQELAEAKRNQQGGLTLEQLQQFAAMQGQRPQQPQETEAEFKERIKEHLYDDPVAVLDEYMAKKLTPEIRRLATNNMFHSQKYLELDPEKGEFYKKYKAEIDQAAQNMPNQDKLYDPQVYQKAYQQVMATHIDDVINQKVQEALETQQAPSKSGRADPPKSHSEVGGMPNPAPTHKKKQVIISDAERQRAALRGVSPQVLAQWKQRHPGQEYLG